MKNPALFNYVANVATNMPRSVQHVLTLADLVDLADRLADEKLGITPTQIENALALVTIGKQLGDPKP